MAEIWTMGEIIVEIMREREGATLDKADTFRGPYPSGAPAIFIDTVARMGHTAGIIGGVGKDDFGKCLTDRLKGDGVDCNNVVCDDNSYTGCAFVTYFEDGSRKFIFHIDNTAAVKVKAPENNIFESAKYFHIMGCSLMANTAFAREILKAMVTAVTSGTKVSFDPNIRPELLKDHECMNMIDTVMQCTSVFMPGVSELLSITGKDTVCEAVKHCFTMQNMELVVLKNGSKGCTVYTRDTEQSFGIYPVTPVDATGAGDSFDGTFICGLCDGLPIEECAKQASAAAALNTAAFGPMEGKISPEAVAEMMRGEMK